MDLLHKNCGGRIVVDITGIFGVRAPAPTVTPQGIDVGVIEIFKRKSAQNITLCCMSCEKSISSVDFDDVLTECEVCHTAYNIVALQSAPSISCVCENCLNILKGKKTSVPSRQATRLKQWLELPKNFPTESLSSALVKVIRSSI